MANAMDVQAVLTANTAGFDGPMKASAAVGEATARQIAKANTEAAKATALASKFAGDAVSQQSLRIVKAREEERVASIDFRKMQALARQGYIDESAGATAAAAALQRLEAAKLATAAASKTEATAAEHAAISEQAAASAAVRSLEGNAGIRSVERFLTTIPGVGEAMKAVFPLIGATAFLGILAKMGTELYELGVKARGSAAATAEAFDEIDSKLRIQNDDLQIQSDKLSDEIAVLSKHPGDGLQTALDESRKRADQLLLSLKADRKELDALFKDPDHSIGLGVSLWSGMSTTGKQHDEMLRDQKALTESIRKANEDYTLAIAQDRAPEAIQAAGARRSAAIAQAISSQVAAYTREAARLESEQKRSEQIAANAGDAGVESSGRPIDNRTKIENVRGRAKELELMLANLKLEDDIAAKQEQKGKLEGAKQLGADQNKAAAAAREAQRKAQEEQMRGMEAQLAALKNDHDVSLAEEYQFWLKMGAAASKYPENLLKVNERTGQLYQEMGRQIEEMLRKSEEANARKLARQQQVDDAGYRLLQQMEQGDRRAADAAAHLAAVQQETQDALQQTALAHDVATGAVSKYEAAIKSASLHVDEYQAKLAELKREQEDDDAMSTLSPEDRSANRDRRDAEVAKVQGDADRQAMTDKWATFSETAIGGATSALQELIVAGKDTAAAMRSLTSGAIEGLNKTLIEQMTGSGQQFAWTHLGRDLAGKVVGSGLTQVESTALSMTGLSKKTDLLGLFGSKRDGSSAATALYVQLAGLGSSVGSTLARGAGGGDAIVSSMMAAAGASTDAGGVLQAALPLLSFAGFAAGGDYGGNSPFWVGEKGPELVVPNGASGSVVPNHQLASVGGDTHHHSYNIGPITSNDPAAVEMAVQRGIQKAAPHIVATSVAAGDSRGRRTPTMNRR